MPLDTVDLTSTVLVPVLKSFVRRSEQSLPMSLNAMGCGRQSRRRRRWGEEKGTRDWGNGRPVVVVVASAWPSSMRFPRRPHFPLPRPPMLHSPPPSPLPPHHPLRSSPPWVVSSVWGDRRVEERRARHGGRRRERETARE
eukprot:scaffold128666_cov35-Tisochrysis_lutea.AAC.1